MHSVAAVLLSFVASTLAYTIISPNSTHGWTNQGPQTLTWQRVNTDRSNFTVILGNQNMTGFQPTVLAALVDGTTGSTTINSPQNGWTAGSSYQINFVQDAEDLNDILVQSQLFNITEATTSTTSSIGSSAASGTSGASGASSTSSTSPTNGAAASYPVQTGLLTLFSLLGFALA